MMISQEYFDEMCLENAELFDDSSPEQAVEATLEQMKMTSTSHNSNNSNNNNRIRHLVTSFPTSPQGIQQRTLVAEFVQALQEIQKPTVVVADKEEVAVTGNDNDDHNDDHHNSRHHHLNLTRLLELIYKRLFSSSCSSTSSTLLAGHENDNDNDSANAVKNDVVDSTVYLALFASCVHDGFGLYLQLWYCLNSNDNDKNGSSTATTATTTANPDPRDDLYRLLWSTLVRVLVENDMKQQKRCHSNEQRRQVLSLYQKSFSTPVISLWLQTVYQKLVQLRQYQQAPQQQQQEQNDDQNAAMSLFLIMQDLQNLFTLAYYSVKQCEANKKALMSVSIVVRTTTISAAAAAAAAASTRRVNLVPVVLESLDWILAQLQKHVDKNSNSNNTRGGGAVMTEEQHSLCIMLWTRDIGRLITALDTFDDFSGATNNTTSSSSSSAGVVSCGHDHVQAWKNARAMDKLHALLVEILKQQQQQQRQPQEAIDGKGQHVDDQQVTTAMTTTTRVDADDAVSDAAAAAAAIVLALRSMAIQDDAVQAMVAIGVLETATQILLVSISSTNHKMISATATSSLELLSAVMGLVRNLCANDEIKTNLCLGSVTSGEASTMKSSIVPGIVHAMQQYRLQQVLKKDNATTCTTVAAPTTTLAAAATLQEHAIGTLAAMALRKPFNSDFIVRKCHAHVDILQAMRDFPQKTTLQRQGALCIRNLASRAWTMSSSSSSSSSGNSNSDNPDHGNDDEDNQDLRTILLQADAATVLRETAAKHLHCQDEVYAALRDLGVPNIHFTVVHLDSAQSTTTTTTSGCTNDGGLTTFGQGHNRNFRPVQDEST